MNEMTLYWITRLDGIKIMLAILTAIFLTFATFHVLYAHVECKKLQKKWVVYAVCGFVGLVLLVLTPTTKEMALIKVVPPVVESAQKANVSEKVCNALLKILDEKTREKRSDGEE
jgi:uncharacterized membrane protein